jgi:hypothetical protein
MNISKKIKLLLNQNIKGHLMLLTSILLVLIFQIGWFDNSAMSEEIDIRKNLIPGDWPFIARIAEIARLDPNYIKYLKEKVIMAKIQPEESESKDVKFNEFKREELKKWSICALYAAGYNKEAQKLVKKIKISHFFTNQVKDQCSELLTKPIESKYDLDNKWAAYIVANDAKYLEMIIEPIKNLMSIPGVTKEDIEYVSFVTHNYSMEESMKLFNGLLNKARSDREKENMEMGIFSLWSFGSVVKKIPKLKKLVDADELLLNNEYLQKQLKTAHYSSYWEC